MARKEGSTQKTLLLIGGGCLGMGCMAAVGVFVVLPILAAVAVPRLVDSTDAAQRAVALDFVSQLNSASAMYTAQNMQVPEGFSDFVTTGALQAGESYVISTATLGDGSCTVEAKVIDCPTAFDRIGPIQYYWGEEGKITHSIPMPDYN